MKCRTDYVSNSSSTSFIVNLPKPIEDYDIDEFKQLFNRNNDDVIDRLYENLRCGYPKYSYKVTDMELGFDLNEENNDILLNVGEDY